MKSCKILMLIAFWSAIAIGQAMRQVQAEDDPADIIWGVNTAPPFHISQGDYQGEGICDVLVDVMKQELPELQQQIRQLPARRITLLMKRERNLCFPCLIKRSSYNAEFNYTDTTHSYPPHGIVAHANAAKKITDRYGNPVSFEALVQDNRFRFAQPIERRYGELQPLVEKHLIGKSHYRIVTGDNAHVNLMTMMLNHRVDYTVDYEMIKRFYEADQVNETDEQLVFLPIAEYQGKVIEGAIGCSNNDWGKRAAEHLNSAVERLQANARFQQALDQWLGEQRPKP